jgi:perosamine synthetase
MSRKFIPLSVPNLKGRELEYVTHAVTTEWVSTGGPYVNEFEEKTAKYVNSKGAVSVQNGTAGLHIALQVCGVDKGDEVIVPTLTFIAAVNPVKYIGAEPVFMDCDNTLCMDPEKLLQFCHEECTYIDGKLINNSSKKHIKAILVVHVFGNMCDMEKINQIASEFNLKVVEDATEAIGSYYTEGKYAGKYAGTIGNVGVYSYNGNKIMTTGGGGMIVSNEAELLEKSKHLTTQAKSDELYYTHDEIGYNYRMTNLQAALGLAQLEQLESFIETKRNNFDLYSKEIEDIQGLSFLQFDSKIRSNYWFYALIVDKEYSMNRDQIINYLSTKKVQVRPIWGLINEQKPYLENQAYQIEKAKIYWEKVINIPCSSNLSEIDVQYVVDCFKEPIKN